MINRARILTERGLVCSIKTLCELRQEQRSTAILRLLGWVAASCDLLCDGVSSGIIGATMEHDIGSALCETGAGEKECLRTLLKNDLKLLCRFGETWHSLLLTLLSVPNFKAAMSKVQFIFTSFVSDFSSNSFTLSFACNSRIVTRTDSEYAVYGVCVCLCVVLQRCRLCFAYVFNFSSLQL